MPPVILVFGTHDYLGNQALNLGVPTENTHAVRLVDLLTQAATTLIAANNYALIQRQALEDQINAIEVGYEQVAPVRTVATANTLLTATVGTVVGGVTLAMNDRVGLVGQTNPVDNGIYDVGGSGLTRASDSLLPNTAFRVTEGDLTNAFFVLINETAPVIGADPIIFVNQTRALILAGAGLILNTVSNAYEVGATNSTILVSPDGIEVSPQLLSDISGQISTSVIGLQSAQEVEDAIAAALSVVQPSGTVFAAPASADGIPTFRTLTIEDVGLTGVVTSVGLALPSLFTVSNSPVIASGNLTAALVSQAVRTVFAAPSSADGTPTFRLLSPQDAGFGSQLTWDSTSQTLRITKGTTTAAPIVDGSNSFVGIADSSNNIKILLIKESGSPEIKQTVYSSESASHQPLVLYERARGTILTPSAVTTNDVLGQTSFKGYDGTAFISTAGIQSVVDGVVSASTVPTALIFKTGTTGEIERLRIASNGNVTTTGTFTSSGLQTTNNDIVLNSDAAGSGADWTTTLRRPGTGQTANLIFTVPANYGTNGQFAQTDGAGNLTWADVSVGTVTSVGLNLPASIFDVGAAVTTSGTLTATLDSQTTRTVFAAPASADGIPTFRALTLEDVGLTGVVTSVGLTLPNIFSVSNSPVTATGNLTAALVSQTTRNVLAAPTSADGVPSFRALTIGDVGLTNVVTSVGLALPNLFTVSSSPVTTTGTLTAALVSQTARNVFAAPTSNGTPTFRLLSPQDAGFGDELTWNSTNKNLRVTKGTTTAAPTIDSSNSFVGVADSSNNVNLWLIKEGGSPEVRQSVYSSESASHQPFLLSERARGSLLTPSAVTTNDVLGSTSFRGHDGTGFIGTSAIQSVVDAAVSTNTVPTALVFKTGTTGENERLRIASSGAITAAGTFTAGGLQTTTNDIVLNSSATATGSDWTTTLRRPVGGQTANLIFTIPPNYGTSGQVATTNGAGAITWATVSGGGSGTVTSVGLSLPSIFSVTNSPVTTTGTLTGDLVSQTAKTFLAAPNGANGIPTFRALAASDIPLTSANILVGSATGIATPVVPSGDVTLSNAGVATIANSVVTNAKLRDSAALSVIGKASSSAGVPADIVCSANDLVLRRAGGGSLSFGTIVTGGIANSAVTYAKVQNVSATGRLLGRVTAGAGVIEEIETNGALVTPTLLNGWVALGGTSATPSYWIDALGQVHIKGGIKDGTTDTIVFNLIAGYRPANTFRKATLTTNGVAGCYAEIYSNGNFFIVTPTTVSVSFDDFIFSAGQ